MGILNTSDQSDDKKSEFDLNSLIRSVHVVHVVFGLDNINESFLKLKWARMDNSFILYLLF